MRYLIDSINSSKGLLLIGVCQLVTCSMSFETKLKAYETNKYCADAFLEILYHKL